MLIKKSPGVKPVTTQPTIKEVLRVDQTKTNPKDCDNMKPDCEKNKPERHYETKPSKPRKPKTKVVRNTDIRLFLTNKKKERELKQENSRGKTFILPTICERKKTKPLIAPPCHSKINLALS